jgi:hypothetical protein
MVLSYLLDIFKTVKSISEAMTGTPNVQATTLGATGVSGVALIVAIYYGRTMYDNVMHRLDRLEDRISKDLNDRMDDLNTKIDTYHETDVRTYERMLVVGHQYNRKINTIKDHSAQLKEVRYNDRDSESESESESREEMVNLVKTINKDVTYIKKKVKHLHHKKE